MTSSLVAENFGLGVVFKPPDQFQQEQHPYEMRVICIPVESDLYDYDPSAPTEAGGRHSSKKPVVDDSVIWQAELVFIHNCRRQLKLLISLIRITDIGNSSY